HTIRAAPLGTDLPGVLPGPLSHDPQAVDRRLDRPLLPPGLSVPTADHVDLPGERVQTGALGVVQEDREVTVLGVLDTDLTQGRELLFGPPGLPVTDRQCGGRVLDDVRLG